MNFKQGHETNNLVSIPLNLTLEQQKTLQPVITSPKEQNPLNQKETPLNKELTKKGSTIG
ncbi:MAG: hypothetical protein J6T10_18340 [Methanobrevibacter sp.]|nr:hypothetical protein [Methanobrevibacter sp.]